MDVSHLSWTVMVFGKGLLTFLVVEPEKVSGSRFRIFVEASTRVVWENYDYTVRLFQCPVQLTFDTSHSLLSISMCLGS